MFFVFFRRLLVIVLVAISLTFGVYHSFLLFQIWDPQAGVKDEVSVWENRMQPIKGNLPPAVTTVGYLAEWDMPGVVYGKTDQFHEFNLTVYSLAPLIVRRGAEAEWIVGNFGSQPTKKIEAWLNTLLGSYKLEALGSGIYLIHRVKQ